MNKNLKNKDGLTEEEFLAQYNSNNYEKPSVTVDMLLFTIDLEKPDNLKFTDNCDLKLLLIKRSNHPYIGCWALPGGFINMEEDMETGAYRELQEETNLQTNVHLEQLYTFSNPKRDPRMRVISTAYMALTPSENIKKTKAGDDATEAIWFSINKQKLKETDEKRIDKIVLSNKEQKIVITYEVQYNFATKKLTYRKKEDLSNSDLAFDHIEIIDMGIKRLRNKVSYTDIAFNLLPDLFTLDTLQKVYEILLGNKLTKPNFRKKISSMVEKTDVQVMGCAYHRPFLYKKAKNYIY